MANVASLLSYVQDLLLGRICGENSACNSRPPTTTAQPPAATNVPPAPSPTTFIPAPQTTDGSSPSSILSTQDQIVTQPTPAASSSTPFASLAQFSTGSSLSASSSSTGAHTTLGFAATTRTTIPSPSALPNGAVLSDDHRPPIAIIASVTTTCAVILLVGLAIFLFVRRRRRKQEEDAKNMVDDLDDTEPSMTLARRRPPWLRWPWRRLSVEELTPSSNTGGSLPLPAAAYLNGRMPAGRSPVPDGSPPNETAADFYAPEIRDMLRSASGREGTQVSVRVSMAEWSDNSSSNQSGQERVRRWMPYD